MHRSGCCIMSKERQERCAAATVAAAPPPPSWPALQQQHHAAAAYFGLSCALAVLSRPGGSVVGCDLGATGRCRWSRRMELALRGQVGELEKEVGELRRRRKEDARANEKVAGIFAAHEQRWFQERKALRRQVDAVVAAARAREARHEEAAAELRAQLDELQRGAGVKDEAMEEEVRRREETEEKLAVCEKAAEEQRERARNDAQEHAAEMRKHKVAFAEFTSTQRQVEAELARAVRRADSAEAELKAAVARRDDATAAAGELSAEAERLRRDSEHKDKILSAMLRKSKIDMEDREMLVRDLKMCKARRKQAELEAERWRKAWETRHRRGSRSSARCAATDNPACPDKLSLDAVVLSAHDTKILFVDHVEEAEDTKNRQSAPPAKESTTVECVDRYPSHVDDKPVVEEYQELQEWFQMETEKYTSMMRHRHSAELEAFTEQLRLKDEKLEAFRWRTASMDVEVTRLRCRVHELEALLLDRDDENAALREQLALADDDADDLAICPVGDVQDGGDACELLAPCSPVKIKRTEPRCAAHLAEIRSSEPVSPEDHKNDKFDMEAYDVSPLNDTVGEEQEQRRRSSSYRCEIEEEKEVCTDAAGNARSQPGASHQVVVASELALVALAPPEQRSSVSKMDIHALAVSYKIKRLKQQLLVLEKLASAAAGNETATATGDASGGGRQQCRPWSYQLMISFLSKHVKRYQSLEDKIDNLCTRMEENKRGGERQRRRQSREQSSALGQFLEETFQLQRYMVATGQKLLEMQARIAPRLAASGAGCNGDGVDVGRFMDVVGALLRDVQRGLEVRIARIIGDLEGTLTFHGIHQATF